MTTSRGLLATAGLLLSVLGCWQGRAQCNDEADLRHPYRCWTPGLNWLQECTISPMGNYMFLDVRPTSPPRERTGPASQEECAPGKDYQCVIDIIDCADDGGPDGVIYDEECECR